MKSSLNTLQNSLIEIYAALHAPLVQERLDLYPLSDFSVCFGGCLQGKFSIFFTASIEKITSPFSSSSRSLSKTLQNIVNLFNHAVQEAVTTRQLYTHYQIQLITEEPATTPFNGAHVRRRVITLTDTFTPFWQLFVHSKRMTPACRIFLQSVGTSQKVLTDLQLFRSITATRTWVEVEGCLQLPVPIKQLVDLGKGMVLKKQPLEEMRTWIQGLQREAEALPFYKIFSLFKEVENLAVKSMVEGFSLARLLLALEKMGCKRLGEEDLPHLSWRRKLKPGNRIRCNGQPFRLGKSLESDRVDNRYLHFEIENSTKWILRVGFNRLHLEMDFLRIQNDQFCIRSVEWIQQIQEDPSKTPVSGIDGRGRCALLEKLENPLSGKKWSSTAWELNQEDARIALILANHLYAQVAGHFSLEGVSMEHLFFDTAGVLKSSRLIRKIDAEYSSWENFILQASRENTFVLHFLSHVSGLFSHPMAFYFRSVITKVFETGETDLIGRPLPIGWDKPLYRKKIEKLCERAKEIRQACFRAIRHEKMGQDTYSHQEDLALSKNVGEVLAHFYQSSPTPGTLSSELAEQTIQRFSEKKGKCSHRSSPSPSYYEKQVRLMLKKNEAAAHLLHKDTKTK